MAWTRLVSGSTAGNVSMNIDYNVTSVTRTSNTNVRVTYGIRFAMATSTWTSNSIAAFCPAGGTRYFAFNSSSGSKHTSSGTWYYANTTGSTTTGETAPFSIDIPVTITQTSATFEVGYGWNAYTPSQVGKSTISVTFPTGATAPTGCWCSVSNIQETSVSISGGYGSNGNATVTAEGYQYHSEGYGWSSYTGQALAPGVKYWFRYYATNSQGTTYSGETTATTYLYPHCTEAPDFKIGKDVTIKLYNPLNRTVEIQMWNHYSTSFVSDKFAINGTTYTGFKQYADRQYASIWNAHQARYNIDVYYGGNKAVKEGGYYSINGNETPTFETSNITNIVDTLLVDSITGNGLKVIKGHNRITGSITKMTPNYGANGNKYVVTASGTPSTQDLGYNNGATQNFTIENITNNSISVTAYDSRNLYVSRSKTVDLIDYSKPRIVEFTATRLNGLGEYINIKANGNISYWSGWSEIKKYNSVQKMYLRYKLSSSNSYNMEWRDITGLITVKENGSWELSGTLEDVFDVTKRYDFELYYTDLLESSSTSSTQLSTANGFLWRDLANKRLGENKKPERTFDVNGDIGCTSLYVRGMQVLPVEEVAKW